MDKPKIQPAWNKDWELPLSENECRYELRLNLDFKSEWVKRPELERDIVEEEFKQLFKHDWYLVYKMLKNKGCFDDREIIDMQFNPGKKSYIRSFTVKKIH